MCSVRGPAVDLLPTGRRTSDGPDRQGATSMTTDSVQQDMFTVLHGQPAPVVTRWTYTASDPFAISLAIATRSDRWIEWLVARDLVIESISGPVGEGDIRMTPQEVQGYDIVEIEIRSADGRAVLEVDRDLLRHFIEATLDIVALGDELNRLDLDEAIAKITRSCAE
jgi:hypothetical protein